MPRVHKGQMALPPFQSVLEDHAAAVHRLLLATVGADEAEDCFQETLLAALRSYPRLEPGSNLRGWVLAIARNKAIDAHRARARRPLPVDELPEPGVAAHDGAQRDPELWSAVARLPEKQRAAVLFRFIGDLSHREIGRALGCSEAAARRNVHEGLTRLREWSVG